MNFNLMSLKRTLGAAQSKRQVLMDGASKAQEEVNKLLPDLVPFSCKIVMMHQLLAEDHEIWIYLLIQQRPEQFLAKVSWGKDFFPRSAEEVYEKVSAELNEQFTVADSRLMLMLATECSIHEHLQKQAKIVMPSPGFFEK